VGSGSSDDIGATDLTQYLLADLSVFPFPLAASRSAGGTALSSETRDETLLQQSSSEIPGGMSLRSSGLLVEI
jgi:hypothetical protein